MRQKTALSDATSIKEQIYGVKRRRADLDSMPLIEVPYVDIVMALSMM